MIVATVVVVVSVVIATAGTTGPIVGAIIGATISGGANLFTQTVVEGKEFGEIDLMKFAGATVAGAIGGLGVNMLSTMASSGLGDVVGGLISGSITSFEDGFGCFVESALLSGLSYGVAKGITKSLGNSKYKSIRNISKNNSKVNKELKKMGLGNFKIGATSKEVLIKGILDTEALKAIRTGISSAIDFIFAI